MGASQFKASIGLSAPRGADSIGVSSPLNKLRYSILDATERAGESPDADRGRGCHRCRHRQRVQHRTLRHRCFGRMQAGQRIAAGEFGRALRARMDQVTKLNDLERDHRANAGV
jgi:hypothetical protein